ncbi:MAG: hypothetical protein N4A46_11390 [Schleiferiaceae bacterium]|jgi:hypothetical protein|nr:hypothetical protein [Schleiferiaceae bacterium]
MDPKIKALLLLAKSLSWISIIVLVLGGLALMIPSINEIAIKEEPQIFCGTSYLPSYKVTSNKLFKYNCASCHGYNRKMVAISMIEAKQKNESQWIWHFVMHEQELLDAKDSSALAVNQIAIEGMNWKHNFETYLDSTKLWEFIELIE